MDRFSVIICTWTRYKELYKIIDYYSKYSDDIILWDNGGEYKYNGNSEQSKKLKMVSCKYNFGSLAKFKSVSFIINDLVLITDDDVIPKEGFIEDLISSYNKVNNSYKDFLLTIFGVKFINKSYYEHDAIRSCDIEENISTDFAGQVYFGKKKYFMLDFKKTPNHEDDVMLVYLQNTNYPGFNRIVFPTKNYYYSEEVLKNTLSMQPCFAKHRENLTNAICNNDIERINKVLNGEHLEEDNGY